MSLRVDPLCRLDPPRPRLFTTQESLAEHCTSQLEATRRPEPTGRPRAKPARISMDVSTDPDPNMDMQQAHVRNMRSKCRCSCVLQFTLRHGVSSVLHRPPSQMIHCIVLFLWFPALGQSFSVRNVPFFTSPTWGEHVTRAEARLF